MRLNLDFKDILIRFKHAGLYYSEESKTHPESGKGFLKKSVGK